MPKCLLGRKYPQANTRETGTSLVVTDNVWYFTNAFDRREKTMAQGPSLREYTYAASASSS